MRDIENYSIELHKKNLPSLYPYIKYNKNVEMIILML